MTVGIIQQWIVLALAVLAFGMEAFALVDALRHRSEAFTAAGKLTKGKWAAILGVATALGAASLPFGQAPLQSLGFLSIIAVVASAVYLVDVRPAVRQIRGGGGRSGPYGPW